MLIASYLNIYRLFIEDYDYIKDIKLYILKKIEKSIGKKENIQEILYNYIKNWIIDFKKHSFEEYRCFLLENILGLLIKFDNKEYIIEYQDDFKSICVNLLDSDRYGVKSDGLKVFFHIYDLIFKKFDEINYKNEMYKYDFHLFLSVEKNLFKAIKHMDAQDLFEIKWGDFIRKILLFNKVDKDVSGLNDIERQKKYKKLEEKALIYRFYRKLGYWMPKEFEESENIISFILNDIIEEYIADISEETILTKEYFSVCFGYVSSLIIEGKISIVSKILFSKDILNYYENRLIENNKELAIFSFGVKCFLYYISKREDDEKIIEFALKENINSIITSKSFREYFNDYSKLILKYNNDIFDKNLFYKIENYLVKEEEHLLYSSGRFGGGKTMIMRSVVHDFIIFTILYLELESNNIKNLLNTYFDSFIGDESDMILYFSLEYMEKNKDNTINLINKYLEMLLDTKDTTKTEYTDINVKFLDKEDIDIKNNLNIEDEKIIFNKSKKMYNILSKSLKIKVKKLLSEESNEIDTINRELWISKNIKGFKYKIFEYFKNKYENIIYLQDSVFDIPLLKLKDEFIVKYFYTINFSKKFDIFNLFKFDWLESRFVQLLCKVLHNNKYLKLYKTTEFLKHFKNESNFKDFTGADLLGSLHPFRPSKSEQTPEFWEWEKISEDLQIHSIHHDVYYAILLRKGALKIYLEEPIVEERSQKIEDHKIVPDPETGLYRYKVEGGIPLDFTKEELEPYLEKTGRVLEVKIKFSCEVVGESPIGYIIER